MPSVYAHYRFGQDIFEQLPVEFKSAALKYRDLYNMGLQGPDLLFFFRPLQKNYVNRLGHQIHDWSGKKFFHTSARLIRNRKKKDAFLAYICGSVAHYALDLICHPYVEELENQQGLNHCAIEGAFERALIVEDHLPLNVLVTKSLVPSQLNANVIAQFYGRTTSKQILSAIRTMIFLNDALRMKNGIVKKGIFLFLRLVGKYDNISGMIITPTALPEFAESDIELRKRYELAKPVAIKLMTELLTCIQTGQKLSHQFHPTYLGE